MNIVMKSKAHKDSFFVINTIKKHLDGLCGDKEAFRWTLWRNVQFC